eukprot:TRINITY_DN3290_c0_g1_i2.p1 TRINITY_DN3290_c0_g1~~TRINITY_DN3290_c0_g1_i2.p1  ORF type:complete len:282 (+),score=91.93 TRINITY_DN3290_c0_g1_i2:37-846(+)
MQTTLLLALLALSFAATLAQDPADGWMAYAVGTVPNGVQRITRFEAKWTVGAKPRQGSAFFSPWFGMDPTDNLNLIQPVNPWSGDSWGMYTEYYEWDTGYNSNSDSYDVKSGQTLHGQLIYLPSRDSYNLTQTIVETGDTSHQIVKCEDGKKFVVPYIVYEKTWRCSAYPPDQIVTFREINIECDGKPCTNQIQWSAQVKDANCDMTAHIINSTTISITWSTSASSRYDSLSDDELVMLNQKSSKGWSLVGKDGKRLNKENDNKIKIQK